jgi:hypothetical protein
MTNKKEVWKTNFPIYPSDNYDLNFPAMAHPIGMMSTAPSDLVRRVVAAAISHQLGNKSIDYTYKRYLDDAEYDTNDGSRLDTRISAAIEKHSKHFSALLYHVTAQDGKFLGNCICEWTLTRAPHSIRQLLALAHRGNLYECCAVGRMVLEQIAWASEIDGLDEAAAINSIKAESSIRALKKKVPFIGNFYGWLSSHTHWRYEGHIKAMDFSEESICTMLQSSRFKAISLASTLLLLSVATVVLLSLRHKDVSALLNKQAVENIVSGKRGGESDDPWAGLSGPRTSSISEIREMLTLSELLDLLGEIGGTTGRSDKDIILLLQMADELKLVVTRL